MTAETLVVWLIVGGVAGWFAGMIMKSGGLALTGNHIVNLIVTGLIGAVIGGWLFGALNVPLGGGIPQAIISAVIGAVLLIFGMRLISR